MKVTNGILLITAFLTISSGAGQAQSLADLARQEKERQAQQKKATKVYTNDDLGSASTSAGTAASTDVNEGEAPASAADSSAASAPEKKKEDPERVWSKKFMDANAKVQAAKDKSVALQNKLRDLNQQTMLRDDVYDGTREYFDLMAQTRQEMAKNDGDLKEAEAALEDLQEQLRKSGDPIGWQYSLKAATPDPDSVEPQKAVTKDEQYWDNQLSAIDKKYDALIKPLEEERFQLVNRRAPGKEESTAPAPLGMGAMPRINDIDNEIRDLNQKRAQEKSGLIDQAIREGALPGWFR